jgi:hypothetical protein
MKARKSAEEWIESRSSIRGSTLSAYTSLIQRRIKPFFEKMRLTQIGYEQVQRFVNELAVELSPKTAHKALILSRVMLTGKRGGSAFKRGLLLADSTNCVVGIPLVSGYRRARARSTSSTRWGTPAFRSLSIHTAVCSRSRGARPQPSCRTRCARAKMKRMVEVR